MLFVYVILYVRLWPHGYRVGLFNHGDSVREVGGSNPGRSTIIGGVFRPTKHLAMLSIPNMPSILNSKFI